MHYQYQPTGFILVFKTNIDCKDDVCFLTPILNSCIGIMKWSVDLSDIDNVLRIESDDPDHSRVIEIVRNAGFFCEELVD